MLEDLNRVVLLKLSVLLSLIYYIICCSVVDMLYKLNFLLRRFFFQQTENFAIKFNSTKAALYPLICLKNPTHLSIAINS